MSAGLQINFTGEMDEAAEVPGPISLAWTPAIVDQEPETEATTAVAAPAATMAPAVSVPTNTPPSGLREFEKAQVAHTEIKISGAASVNSNDGIEVSLDDRIRVVGEFRVTKIQHYVDKKGDVVRVQYVTPVDDLELTPWDPSNPNDDGIVRVRP